MKEILEKILMNNSNRLDLVKQFELLVANDENVDDIFAELAWDFAFYEPNDELRKQDSSFFGNEQLERLIIEVLTKLKTDPRRV